MELTTDALGREQRPAVAKMLTAAFLDDPLYRVVIPNEPKRRKALLWLHDKVIRYCEAYGVSYRGAELEGIACWLPPGQTEITLGRILRTGLHTMPLRFGLAGYSRFDTYTRYADRLREENTPEDYWYLWVLGVDPSHQGKGVGGQLLQPVLDQADAAATICYLETENERNLGFYRKLGFEVAVEGRVPKLDLPMWSMVRESASAR